MSAAEYPDFQNAFGPQPPVDPINLRTAMFAPGELRYVGAERDKKDALKWMVTFEYRPQGTPNV